jgi:hypothetical protein
MEREPKSRLGENTSLEVGTEGSQGRKLRWWGQQGGEELGRRSKV